MTSNQTKKQKEDARTFVKGAGVSFAGKIVGKGFYGLSQIMLARLLGTTGFGLYALGWTFWRLIGTFVTLGVDRGLIHFAAGSWQTAHGRFKTILTQSFWLTTISGVVLGGLLVFFAEPISAWFEEPDLSPVLIGFGLAMPLYGLLRLLVAGTRVSQQMQYGVIAEDIAQGVTNVALIGLFFWFGWALQGAILATILSFLVAVLMSAYYVYRLFPDIGSVVGETAVTYRQLLAYSLPTALSGVFSLINIWSDRLFLGYLLSADDVGIYQAASQISVIFINIGVGALNAIVAPMIASLYHQEEYQRLNEIFKMYAKWGLYFSLPITIVIMTAAQPLIHVLYGFDYVVGASSLILLTLGQLVNIAVGATGFVLIMTGRQKIWMILSAGMLVVNLTLNWLLVPLLGITGAALATSVSIAGLYTLGLYFVYRELELWPFDRRHLKAVLASICTLFVLFSLQGISWWFPLLELTVKIGVTVILFPLLLWLQGIDEADRELIQKLWQRLGRKG